MSLYHCRMPIQGGHKLGVPMAREPSAPSEAHDAGPQEGESDPAPDESQHMRVLPPPPPLFSWLPTETETGHSLLEGCCCLAHASTRRHHSRNKSGMFNLSHPPFVVPSFLSFVSMIRSGTWCRLN